MYDHLMRIVDDPEIVQQMLACDAYDEFARVLMRHNSLISASSGKGMHTEVECNRIH